MEELKEEPKRVRGKIIHLSPTGWGFISTPELPFTRIFFHWTSLSPKDHFIELRKGMEVEFTPKDYQDKGIRAIRTEVIKDDQKRIGTSPILPEEDKATE
jgi:cold shock CspA family protein